MASATAVEQFTFEPEQVEELNKGGNVCRLRVTVHLDKKGEKILTGRIKKRLKENPNHSTLDDDLTDALVHSYAQPVKAIFLDTKTLDAIVDRHTRITQEMVAGAQDAQDILGEFITNLPEGTKILESVLWNNPRNWKNESVQFAIRLFK